MQCRGPVIPSRRKRTSSESATRNAAGLTTTIALRAGPFLSYASMRLRYCSTSARHVSVPARIAAWTSAIVVSSTRKAGAAVPACALSVRDAATATNAMTSLFIDRGSAKKCQRRLVHARVRRACWCGVIRRVKGSDHDAARHWIEKEKRTEARLTPCVSDDRGGTPMDDKKRERHRVRRRRGFAHRMQRMPHARQRRAGEHDVIPTARRIVVGGTGEKCGIRGQVGERRVPTAVGNRDAW